MRVGKAKRRLLKWNRYVDKTGTQASPTRRWGHRTHNGQLKAFKDFQYAHRWAPNGIRELWLPKWGIWS